MTDSGAPSPSYPAVTALFPKDLFRGQVAFITGGGSGINFGIARSFAALGANLVICSRNQQRLDGAAAKLTEFGSTILPIAADVRDFEAVKSAFEKCDDELGPANLLVCGAAGNFLSKAQELSSNGFRTVVNIDLVGSFNCARAAFPQLTKTRGLLLFVTAGQAFIPFPYQVHAGAAKAGIENMAKNLALEWGVHGIRSNCIAPGFIDDTEGTSRIGGQDRLHEIAQATPLGRLGTVDDVANAAVFLASPLGSFITGASLVVDGGCYLGGASGLLRRTTFQS
jgi:NAD(P)-dependent dehydrogenase (short-subunit alcohol dehydrogenase family)